MSSPFAAPPTFPYLLPTFPHLLLPFLRYDVFVLGTVVGRLFHEGYAYAWFSSALATLTMLVLVVVMTLVMGASEDMERPFSSKPLSLPGLSNVSGTAEMTLHMVVPPDAAAGRANAVGVAREIILGKSVAALFSQPGNQVRGRTGSGSSGT